MAKTRVWVLSALFTTDNIDDSEMDIISVHSSLDDAIKAKDKCIENTKECWLEDGITEDEMSLKTDIGDSVLKAKDNTRRVEYCIYGKDIDNGYNWA